MALTITVPFNTMLADLDETLRRLLRRELGKHGFEGVNIAFDTPTKEWSGALSAPTVNVFLYDLRQAAQQRGSDWKEERGGNGNARLHRPAMQIDCSYAITTWARAVEDEHRILSHVLAVLFAYDRFEPADLVGTLADGAAAQREPITSRIGQAKEERKADFWTAVGGTYRVALDYVVTLAVEPGATFTRGPAVQTASVRLGQSDDRRGPAGLRGSVEEFHHVAGTVVDRDGVPLAGVWVVAPDAGAWAASDADGRFRLPRLRAGEHQLFARGPDGTEAKSTIAVPGPGASLSLS
jgi:hypothetical protein